MEITAISGGVSAVVDGPRGRLELVMLLSLTGQRINALVHHDVAVCDGVHHGECEAEGQVGDALAVVWRDRGDEVLAQVMAARYETWLAQSARDPLDSPGLIAHLDEA